MRIVSPSWLCILTCVLCIAAFHYSGVASKNVTLGIPRIKEILTVTKNIKTPTITLRFTDEFSTQENLATYVADTIPATTLNDIASSCDIVLDPDAQTNIEQDRWMVDVDTAVHPDAKREGKYVVRIVLNRTLMRKRRITPPDVRRVLRRRLGDRAHVISSETNDIEWVVRIRLNGVADMLAHAGLADEREAVIAHRIASVVLDTLVVCGHANVVAATARSETVDRIASTNPAQLRKTTEWVVDVNGGSLAEMAASTIINWSRCYSNDLHDVQSTLGISAAAETLLQELHDVISFDGTYIYPGHLLLIVDTMTRDGRLKPLNRFGVNREHSNAFARSSYEETPEVLTEAAIFAENASVAGVSTNIILGQRAQVGTGIAEVKFHMSMLPHTLKADVVGSSTLVKTVVGPRNITVEPRIEHVVREVDDDNVLDAEVTNAHMDPPYASSTVDAPAPIFGTDAFQPPFAATRAASPSTECVAPEITHPFRVHSPTPSDA